jgi:Lipid A 3-O-deacylase (PagL)
LLSWQLAAVLRYWKVPRLQQIAILLLLSTAPGWAGFCSSDPAPSEPRHDFEFFAGYSPVSATLIGTTTDRRFILAGFGYSYRCWVWPSVSISYTGELMPAAILLQPGQYLPQYVPAHAVYGFAVTPLGFTADFGRSHKVYPFLQTNEGIITSSEPIPINVTGATGLNFLIDLGGGVRVKTGQRHAITFGYKFLHISNGFTSPVNPGVDNNVFYAGFSILK